MADNIKEIKPVFTSLLIVAYKDEAKEIKQVYPDLKYDKLLNNHSSSVGKVQGLRINEVYVSYSVLISGILPGLLDNLHLSMIALGIDPMTAFKPVL